MAVRRTNGRRGSGPNKKMANGESPNGNVFKNIKPIPKDSHVSGYNPLGDEKKVYDEFMRRKSQLLSSRNSVYGLDIDQEMRRFDRMYFRRAADIPASELDPNQRPIAINNAYGKIQTALSIMIDQNPVYKLNEDDPKFSANRELIRQLAQKSFRNTNSLGQYKLTIFNTAKRGWGAGRTFHRQLVHEAGFPIRADDKGKVTYQNRWVTKVDDIAYMNLSNYNVWFDEQSKPEDFFSTRDWMWREVWYIDDLRRTFPEDQFPNMKYVTPGGDTREQIQGTYARVQQAAQNSPQSQKPGMVEVFFYENQYADQFLMVAHDVMVIWEPLPQFSKRISGLHQQWHLRSDDTIYGIGIIEEMEHCEELADRILNMSLRQLLLTIAPMGFYTGNEDFEDENIRITPGVMRRTMDPNAITWTQIPEGNQNAIPTLEWVQGKEDDHTGINKSIEGTSLQKNTTAFQVGVDREAGLRRLRVPLKSFQYALDWEFQNRIALIQQVYSDFQVEHLASDEEIFSYLDEVEKDPDFYFIENEGDPENEKFYAKRYRKVSLNLDQDDNGNFLESDSSNFFHIKPAYLAYQGTVTTDMNSLLVNSEQLEKTDTLQLANIIIPLLAQPKEVVGKPVKQILASFNKDPKKWLPQDWLDYLDGKARGQQDVMLNDATGPSGNLKTVVPKTDVEPGNTPMGIPQERGTNFAINQ